MPLNFWAGFGSGSAALEANAGAIRDIVVRTLVTTLMCLASAFVHSGYAFAFEGGPQDGVVSSPRQLPSGQAGTALATKAARTDNLGIPGSELSVKWEAGKLSLDADGALLSEVLQAVSHKTGIEVTGVQGLNDRVFTHFAEMDLLEALKELLSRVNYAIAIGPPGSTSAQGTRVMILNGAADSGPPRPLVTAEANAPAALEAALQEPDAESQESKLAATQAAATGGDREALRKYLQDADVAIQAAAFDALSAQGEDGAVEDLLANVEDTSQPTRLQALELLIQTAGVDEQTMMAVLHDALEDPDPAFNAYAVQVLVGRGNADAMDALREALHSTDPSTRLMVLESVVSTEAGLPLLREALADSDETVSVAAATLLKQAEAGTGAAGKP